MKVRLSSWYVDPKINKQLREDFHLDENMHGVIDWDDLQKLFQAYNIAIVGDEKEGVAILVVKKNEFFSHR